MNPCEFFAICPNIGHQVRKNTIRHYILSEINQFNNIPMGVWAQSRGGPQ